MIIFLFEALPGLIFVGFALQTTLSYRRSPNPYRLNVWRFHILTVAGLLIGLYLPQLPFLVPMDALLVAHLLFLMCNMLAGLFVLRSITDVLEGWNSPAALRQHRRVTLVLLGCYALMAFLGACGIADGEREGSSYFPINPVQHLNLTGAYSVYLLFEVGILTRLITALRLCARLTPVPAVKTGIFCLLLATYVGYAVNGLCLLTFIVPAQTPYIPIIQLAILGSLSLFAALFLLGMRLIELRGKGLRRFGTWIWELLVIGRLYPLWHALTTTIPEVRPPLLLPWMVAFLQGKMQLLHDARIIEMLDVLQRLDLTLETVAHQPGWIQDLTSVTRTDGRPFASLHQQARTVDFFAQKDAAKIMLALANYRPGSTLGGWAVSQDARASAATLTHAPAFGIQEVHYLELVAFEFTRMHTSGVLQEASVLGVAHPAA